VSYAFVAEFAGIAARAAVKLERLRVEERLVKSERRYRNLYEQAPTAYVSLVSDGTLRSVNLRATQMLGFSAQELIGTSILSYLATSLKANTLRPRSSGSIPTHSAAASRSSASPARPTTRRSPHESSWPILSASHRDAP
jgi:PAS domain-containing protein